jgi:membrane-bound lytic murein transglycosylase A
VACGSVPLQSPPSKTDTTPGVATAPVPPGPTTAGAPLGSTITQPKSRWVAAAWSELPGWEADATREAWGAWLKSCANPNTALAKLCPELRRLSAASEPEQRAWMQQRLQPYRIEALQGGADGLLTGYYEPLLQANRLPTAGFTTALYRAPVDLASRKPWYTRQEIDTLPQARAALADRAIAYVADPVDALVLQIQGSGRLRVKEPDGSLRIVRVAFAGTNSQPYKSVGRYLAEQGLIKDTSWPGIKAWIAANPQRVQEMLWSNPRVVFFKEEAVNEDASAGPKGAQGVPLSAGRSVAVDVASIPYGTPLWLSSTGPAVQLQRLVIAQDTGSAILGAVRADYYVGTGFDAGEVAGRLKQPLQLWALWPKP